MKAAVFYGPRDVRVEDVPEPKAGAGEVALRVLRCSVCGTDKRIYTHGQKNVVPPAIAGPEIVGTVHKKGPGVERAHPDLLGMAVRHITPVTLGEAVREAQRLPASRLIEGAAKAHRIHRGFDQRQGMPVVAFPVGAETPQVER